MDTRTRDAWRTAVADPGDEVAQERLERLVQRLYTTPEDAFQADIFPEGRLDKALSWELEYSKISVQIKDGGGLISANSMFGRSWSHIRIWYPSFEDVLEDLLPGDIRIAVSAAPGTVLDIIETLEGYYPAATIVSAGVAVRDPDGPTSWGGLAKPKRWDRIDKEKMVETGVGARSTHHRGWGDSSWVS